MKKFLTFLCAMVLVVGLVASASATPIYYQATNVVGVGTITYGYTPATINDAPVFTFTGISGDVDENLSSFTPGEYTIDFTLTGFWADYDENGSADFTLPNIDFTSGPYNILSAPTPSGTYGQLSWNVDIYSGGWISYDFGTTGSYTNAGVNNDLGMVDFIYSGATNGVMNADIRWDTLRVELNSTAPVPEPSTILLMGIGLLGLVGYSSRKRSKKS